MSAGSYDFVATSLYTLPVPSYLHIPATVCLPCRCAWWINPS